MSAAKITTDSKPLKRGKACLTCRFLKIKCDGAKPICGPCLHHPKDDECEYADSPRRSRTKQLEDQVARLEARLRDLEHPEPPATVLLHQPYTEPGPVHSSFSPSTSSHVWTQASSPYSPGLSPLEDTSLGLSGRRTESPLFNPDEPSPQMARDFIDLFSRNALELGFFLNSSRFYHSAKLPLPLGHEQRPCASVLSAIYLWGSHLAAERSPLPQSPGSERHYLQVALKHSALGLTSTHPDRHMHAIQAEVLLAYYFLRIGNFLEARRHSSSALSLAIGCGLHRIRSEYTWPPPTLCTTGDESSVVTLPRPSGPVEEGERIDGFWQVVILSKTLAVAIEVPAEVCGQLEAPGFQIDTPWPLDQTQYEDGLLPPPSTSTIAAFVRQHSPVDVSTSASLLALTAQAATLLHQVTFLAGQWSLGRNTQTFPQNFQVLNQLITTLRHNLPSLHRESRPLMFFGHALALAATIKLNEVVASSDFRARQDCVTAAQTMVHWSHSLLKTSTCPNPIMGTLVMTACQALIDEVLRLRNNHPLLEDSKEFTRESIDQTLRLGLEVLYLLSRESPLMRYQLTTMQALYSSL